MAWVAVGVAAFSLISSAQQAEGIRENAKLSKEVAELNAKYAEIDAYEAEQQGLTEEARYQSVIDSTVSAQRLAFAVQDVDVNTGIAKELQNESRLVGMLNKMDIKNQAHARALGIKGQARQYRLQGSMDQNQARGQASAVQNAGVMSAVSTSLSGYGSRAAQEEAAAAARKK